MAQIAEDIGHALDAAGLATYRIDTVLAPAWTTDWITAAGPRQAARVRHRAADAAIAAAPPSPHEKAIRFVPRALQTPVDQPACPRCGSPHTERLAQFGSTACKALYRCLDCREPFDYFKPY